MPELPEVEVTRRSIEPRLRQARVLGARLGKPLRWPLGCDAAHLVGREVGPISRRGKYLWLALGPRPGHPAEDASGLLMHLGMSGSLTLVAASSPLDAHEHFELATTGGTLRLKDPRRFGAVIWAASMDEGVPARLLARLGPEPDDPALSDSAFHAVLRRRRSAVKAALLSGELVVGAGNIYACEALFASGIDPRARCDRISRVRAARLLQAVRQTLGRAVALGGSTLRDFRDAHGMNGAFQTQACVYGREGEPCTQCGAAIRRIVQAQRSTYFCPRCQKK